METTVTIQEFNALLSKGENTGLTGMLRQIMDVVKPEDVRRVDILRSGGHQNAWVGWA